MKKTTLSFVMTITMLILSIGIFDGGLVADQNYSVDQTFPPYAIPGVPYMVIPGSPVAVAGNDSVELVTPSGISVKVIPGETVEITIDESSENTVGAIPTDLISFGLYLTIEMNDTSVDVDATIEMPYDETMIEGMNETALEFRFYNESSAAWEAVPTTVDLENKIVSAVTDHFSTWTVISDQTQGPPEDIPKAEPGTPFEITPGKPVAVAGNESVELVTPNGVSVNVIPGETVEITIDEFVTNPVKDDVTAGLTSLGIYLSIEMNETDVDVSATLSLPYDATTLGDLDEESLEFRFYNESSAAWEVVPSWVDLENKIVYGNTTHFSTWTITGSVDDTSTSSSDSTPEDTTSNSSQNTLEDTNGESQLGLNLFILTLSGFIALLTLKRRK